QTLHQEHGVDEGRRHEEEHHHHGEAVTEELRVERDVARGQRVVGRIGHQRCPKRPCGRNMRTIAMITKITVFDASGKKTFVRPSTTPSANPVRIDPMIDPIPPITTTANTTMIRSAPMSGLTW